MLKKVLALTLTLALCLSLSTVVSAADFVGEPDLKVPLYTVVVPTDFTSTVFIDPIEIGGAGQLYCGENGFVFANKTPVPIFVNVSVTMTAAATSGITLVDDPDDVTTGLNPPADEKNMYLGIEAPIGMTASSGVTDPNLAETDILSEFGDDDTKVILPFVVDEDDDQVATTSFSLVLDTGADALGNDAADTPLTGDDNHATTEESLGAFKFHADLTTYNATWAKKDLKFEGTFEFQGLRAVDYADAVDAQVEGSHNLYQSGGADALGWTGEDAATLDYGTFNVSWGTNGASNDVILPFTLAGKTITDITETRWGSTALTGAEANRVTGGTNTVLDVVNGKLVVKNSFANATSGTRYLSFKIGDTTYKAAIAFAS